jgi:protein-S-isoprenylcysteine O-methyltransferase Ste14
MPTEKLIYDALLTSEFILAPLIFITLLKITAPYGRHTKGFKVKTINVKQGWILMELPAVLVILIFFTISSRTANILPIIFLVIWEIHYAQRTFIYPVFIRPSQTQLPLTILIFGLLFNMVNGYLNGRYLFHFSPEYKISWIADPRFIIGVIIFFTGLVINIHSDYILRNLRKPGDKDYKIPYSGLFEYISCPNYFGEIVEWTGWAIATWSLPGLAFAIFTFANLGPRARSHHMWYLRQFSQYPKNRKALIPFIY